MKTWEITLLIILILLLTVIVVTIWRAFFSNSVRILKGKIEEYVVVIDIAVAVKKDFLMRLAKLVNFNEKDIPKNIKGNPLSFWTNLERELYIKTLNNWEDRLIKVASKNEKVNKTEMIDLIDKITNTEERIKAYIFTYNNSVLKYNYKLSSKQGTFFLNSKKFSEKELLNLNNNLNLTEE